MDEDAIRCEECYRKVDEMVAAAEHWVFWPAGHELVA